MCNLCFALSSRMPDRENTINNPRRIAFYPMNLVLPGDSKTPQSHCSMNFVEARHQSWPEHEESTNNHNEVLSHNSGQEQTCFYDNAYKHICPYIPNASQATLVRVFAQPPAIYAGAGTCKPQCRNFTHKQRTLTPSHLALDTAGHSPGLCWLPLRMSPEMPSL